MNAKAMTEIASRCHNFRVRISGSDDGGCQTSKISRNGEREKEIDSGKRPGRYKFAVAKVLKVEFL